MAINVAHGHEHITLTISLGSEVTHYSMVILQVGREHIPKDWHATVRVTDDPAAYEVLARR